MFKIFIECEIKLSYTLKKYITNGKRYIIYSYLWFLPQVPIPFYTAFYYVIKEGRGNRR